MREIKFRGKVLDHEPMTNPKDGWVEGFYRQDLKGGKLCHYIFNCPIEWEIDAETVGQFTGLHDKNGKEIYEGDILLWVANTKIDPYENGQEVNSHFKRHLVVAWAPQCQGFGLCLPCEAHIDSPDVCAMAAADRMYIVGNIHDNPEMLNKNE